MTKESWFDSQQGQENFQTSCAAHAVSYALDTREAFSGGYSSHGIK